MNFLNDSIPEHRGMLASPIMHTKLGHSFPHLLPKQRLTHASREDLFPIQGQAASQKTSGFLPASGTAGHNLHLPRPTRAPSPPSPPVVSSWLRQGFKFTRQCKAGRLSASQPLLHKLRMWRGNKVNRYHH